MRKALVVLSFAAIFCLPQLADAAVSGNASTSAGGLAGNAGFSTTPRSFGGGGSVKGEGGRSPLKATGHYFLSRFYDLIDILDFSVGAGPGFLIQARMTKLAQIGGGYSDAWRLGFRGRSAGIWREIRKEVGISLLYYQKFEREKVAGWVETLRADKMDLDTSDVFANNNDRSFLGVGATVHIGGLLVDVNARPMQAIDFVLGLFTIDVLDDDTGKPYRVNDL